MGRREDVKGRNFSIFLSAGEESEISESNAMQREDEGGHMSSTCGRIVRAPGADLPYKVVLTHHGRDETTQSFATMREAEAFIRSDRSATRR